MRITNPTDAAGPLTRYVPVRTLFARALSSRPTHAPLLAALAVPTLVLSTLPAAAHGQSAAELMSKAMEAQEARLAHVNDVTITQDAMGMAVGMYMEKRVIDGTSVLVPVSVIMAGRTTAVPQDEMAADWSNPFQETWAERARLEGTEQMDGRRVHVMVMDDFTGLELPGMPGEAGGGADFRPRSMRFFLDDDYLIRKVDLDAQVTQDDGTVAPVQITMFMEDYREVSGYVHPFRTRTVTRGMMAAADVDQEELRAQLEEMKKQLANMPEAQRAMMERMMGPQMESLQAMLSSGEGEMEMTITVTDLKVNAGPPGGD
jgi:hypothetical protein